MRQPNTLAWLALYGWPFVVLGTYALRRSSARLSRTTAWMMLLPVMFLPAGVKLPFAALDKHRIAFLSIAMALVLFHARELRLGDRWRRFPFLVLLVFSLGTIQTVRTNMDPLSFGILKLPGLGPRDLFWMIYGFFVEMALPFMIGQRVFRTERDLRDLLEVLSKCVLIYAPLCLIEMRLSPQFSNWVYGYFPHSFAQTVRGSGYRPVVFMNHGLSVGMFMFSGLCASLTLRSANASRSSSYTWRSLVALMILLPARNLAALIYSGVVIVLQLWASARTKARVVMAMALLFAAYPALRISNAVPAADIGDFFAQFSQERSASLMFRFRNELALVERAMERPLYGWGHWGRSRIYVSWGELGDSWAGFKDASITDGSWIIWLGSSGFIGLAAFMALLVAPLLRSVHRYREMSRARQVLTTGFAVMLAIFCIDLLPNAQSDFLAVAYSGALFTLAANLTLPERHRAHPAPTAPASTISEPFVGAH